jgi:2-polyprenyl-6-methoxyphenol hydroxylase-like FAD-dependent oxidoreductase
MAMLNVVERTRNVEIVFGKKVIGGEEFDDRAVLHFQDGTEASGDLVIGCDGVHSAVRTQFVDPDRPAEYTGLSFLQATIESDSLSSPIHFKSSSLNISRHGSMLASYCDRDGDQIFAAAIVQFSQDALSRYRLEPGQDWATQHRIRCGLREEIRDRFGKSSIPCIREMINSKADWMLYPVFQVQPGGRWCLNRVILLGDAAHAVSVFFFSFIIRPITSLTQFRCRRATNPPHMHWTTRSSSRASSRAIAQNHSPRSSTHTKAFAAIQSIVPLKSLDECGSGTGTWDCWKEG